MKLFGKDYLNQMLLINIYELKVMYICLLLNKTLME